MAISYIISLVCIAIMAIAMVIGIRKYYKYKLECAEVDLNWKKNELDAIKACKKELYKKYINLEERNGALSIKIKALEHAQETDRTTIEFKNRTIDRLEKERDDIRNKANRLWETGERLDRELREVKVELDRTRSGNDTLIELVKTLQPKENQKPVKCEKGEWCKTCTFNKPFTFIHNGDRIYLDICMKNCSCNNFVAKEG